jgi:ribosome biogenesis GTPase
MQGVVIRTTGSWITVSGEDGATRDCRLKGNFRLKGIKTTNPVAVGDRVIFSGGESEWVITRIQDRDNYIIRRATKLSKVSHILAANIDQAVMIASLASPRTSTGFIDRFLVTAEAYHIPCVIAFNKADMFDDQLEALYRTTAGIYEDAGYLCLRLSALTGEGLDSFREALTGKISLLSGHSGAGKTTLINKIQPGLDLKVLDISAYHRKGQHATTFAEMFTLSFGARVIDTPGIKEFGLIDFERGEVAERFPEIRRYLHDCRYNDCTHTHEPGCAVKNAVGEGLISPSRYDNYLRIYYNRDWEEDKRD